ncbi:MAG: nucleotidyl transferase AbiEii/AbiGii toxin family protein [Bacteroidota bacterium]
MNNTYKTSLSKLRSEHLKDLFTTLEEVLLKEEIDFYFLGAFAKDVWNSIFDLPSNRMTKDIDIAVFVPNKDQFQAVRDALVASKRFAVVKNHDVKFLFDQTIELDVIPFGGYDIFDDRELEGFASYALLPQSGFKVVYEEGLEQVIFDGDFQFKVSSLPSIVILKLLAYDNVPEYRAKDLKDIFHILQHYFDVADEEIYNQHLGLFDSDEFDTTKVAARVMGRSMQPILQKNQVIREKIIELLEKEQKTENMASKMVAGMDMSVSVPKAWLRELLEGILEVF